jgi:hypothetical protein
VQKTWREGPWHAKVVSYEKFRNLAPDWSATLDLAPNSTPLQNLAPRPRIVSKNRQHLIFYCFSPFCHCFL